MAHRRWRASQGPASPLSTPAVQCRRVLLLLLLLLCSAPHSQAQLRRRGGTRNRQQPLKLHDFVLVMSTTKERLPLVHASRAMRVGLRTFITVGNKQLAGKLQSSHDARVHGETYAYYPDRLTGTRLWESRYVATPFLAHYHYGDTFKWMLLGDDDTLWFLPGLKRLLLRFDSSLPYYISDNIVDYLFKPKTFLDNATDLFMGPTPGVAGHFLRPSWLGTTCLPCHASQAETRLRERFRRTPLETHQWLGCPCVNTQGCYYRRHMCAYQHISDSHFCTGKWDPSRAGLCTFSWPWGGTGTVLSQGLLHRLSWQNSMRSMVEEFLSLRSFDHHAGDWMLAYSLYDLRDKAKQDFPGYGITIPAYSAVMKGEVLHSDLIVFGPVTHRGQSIVREPAKWLRNRTCDTDCLWLLRHVVSHHESVNGLHRGSIPATAAAIKEIAASHRAALVQLGEPVEHLAANLPTLPALPAHPT